MTGAILDGYAVCDGYANLFHYMANATGLLTFFEHGVLKEVENMLGTWYRLMEHFIIQTAGGIS